jgi:hypothetical protein
MFALIGTVFPNAGFAAKYSRLFQNNNFKTNCLIN